MAVIGGASINFGIFFIIGGLIVLGGFLAGRPEGIGIGAMIIGIGLFGIFTATPNLQHATSSISIPFAKEFMIAISAGLVVAIIMKLLG